MMQSTGPRINRWLRDEFQPTFRSEGLLPGLTAGVLIGATEVIFALSVGSLIFSGELAPYVAYGIGIALVTETIMLIGVALSSSVAGVVGIVQDSPSVILAAMAAALVATLPASSAEARLATVLVAIAVTALLTGVFLWALGTFRLGGLVRYLPYPVVGGFLAGTGWLLVRGSFGVMADYPLAMSNLAALAQPDQLLLWVPGVVLALVLLVSLRYVKNLLVMPGILVAALALFYLSLLATGTSVGEATSRGLLLGGASADAVWRPLAAMNLPAADWTAILGQGGNIAVILVLSVVGLLLNASGIELALRRDLDLNRELQAAGLANIVSGLGGGAVGFHALDVSTLCCRIGARSRLPGLVAGVLCGVVLLAGTPLLAFFPKPILGGLLFFLGAGFLVEWVIDGWSKLSRADYAVVLLILVVIGATDFLIGVAVGLVAMIVLFVLNYSRIDVVHHALSGGEIKSNVERCTYHRRRLRDLGLQTFILQLRGFLFFGTANGLLERIRARVADRQATPVRFLVLDFRRVTGLDSSAVISFVKVKQLAEAQGMTLVLTHLSEEMRQPLARGALFENKQGVRVFPDLDRGLEWCENQLLEMARVTHVDLPITLRAQLADGGFERSCTARLMPYLEKVEIATGEYLIRQGEEADDLYFIEFGGVSAYLELDGSQQARLHALGPGTVVGELGLYLGKMRTASVMADWPTTAYRLTQKALKEMEGQDPELAASFHQFLARMLSERLASTTRSLEAVLR